jgi:macrolide-specific efflux system membrane fusion protein
MADAFRNRTAEQPAPLVVVPPVPPVPPASRRKRRRARWPWLALAAILLVLAGAAAWLLRAANEPAENVVTEAVLRGDIDSSVTAAGSLSPIRDVDVGVQVSGQLKSLKVAIGDRVSEGDLIAEIDAALIETQIETNGAELADLQAQMINKTAQAALKRSTLARQKELVAGKSVTKAVLEQAVADVAAAEADIESLKARIRKQDIALKDSRINLGYTKIFAPMSGTIVSVSAKEGQTLNANQAAPTIVRIADLSTMTAKAQVSEADVSRLKLGMTAYFTLLGQQDFRYEGKLRQIEPTPSTQNNVVLYNALFDVPNPDGTLMIDMTAQVFFTLASAKDVLTVPLAALQKDSASAGTAEVRVQTAPGELETRTVKTGIRNRVRAQIVEGLAEGDEVVVATDTEDKTPPSGSRGRAPRGMGMF